MSAKFVDRLSALGFSSYDDYLRSEHWLDFRTRYRFSNMPQTCVVCGATFVCLHHVTYIRLGAELLSDVVPLCKIHHKAVHEWLKTNNLYVEYTNRAVEFLKTGRSVVVGRKSKNAGKVNEKRRKKKAKKVAKKKVAKAARLEAKLLRQKRYACQLLAVRVRLLIKGRVNASSLRTKLHNMCYHGQEERVQELLLQLQAEDLLVRLQLSAL